MNSASAANSVNSVNIASHLVDMARRQPDTPAIMAPRGRGPDGELRYDRWTYRQLDDESDAMAHGLHRIGIDRGMRTVLMAPPSLEFFALAFALFKLGAVMVGIDPGMGIKNLRACLAEAEPTAFIGVAKAHWARRVFGWAKVTNRINIVVGPGRWSLWPAISLQEARRRGQAAMRETGSTPGPAVADTDPFDVAAILFTSGSTGVPKGVVYRHSHFDAQVRTLAAAYDIRPGEVDLATFPLFALFAPALGMTAVVPDMDFTRPGEVDPRAIAGPIERFGVTNMFGSPALLDRVGQWGAARGVTFPSLRRVISAGAPVHARVLERFTQMLAPGVQVYTPYGATEALPVASIGSDEILGQTRMQTDRGAGVCVGRPVDGMCVRVIKITDEPIVAWSDDLLVAAGSIGEIVVRGPTVTDTYYRRPQSTELAKIRDSSGGVYHRMGDVGYVDERGRLWFCGRKSQRVKAPGGDLFTIPCEAVFNTHPRAGRTALVGVGFEGAVVEGGVRPVLCVELTADAKGADVDLVRRELLEIGAKQEHTKGIADVLFHPRFPVDIRHNAKIGREALAAWAAGQLRGRTP